MAADSENEIGRLCLVCNKQTKTEYVSIHSKTSVKNGSIQDQISDVIGKEDLEEACQASDIICSNCFKILLNIDDLECELYVLKLKFYKTFQMGAESRKNNQELASCALEPTTISEATKDSESHTNTLSRESNCSSTPDSNHVRISNPNSVMTVDVGIITNDYVQNQALCQRKTSNIKLKRIKDKVEGRTDTVFKSNPCVNKTTQRQVMVMSDSQDIPVGKEPLQEGRSQESEARTFGDIATSSGSLPEASCKLPLDSNYFDGERREGITEDDSNENILGIRNDIPEDFENFESNLSRDDVACSRQSQKNNRLKKRTSEYSGSSTAKKKRLKVKANQDTRFEDDLLNEGDTTGDWSKDNEGNDGEMECEICKLTFCETTQLQEHRADVHPSVYCYLCHHCINVRYRYKSKLTLHLQRVHQTTLHQCLGCGYEAKSQNSLDQHLINKHPDSRFFQCDFCPKAFRTYRYLHFVHIKRCHIGLPIKYSCTICRKGFVDKTSYENHKVTHSKDKNFTCEFCGTSFNNPYALKVHVNCHTREKKYNCTDCGASFLRQGNFIAHKKRFHTDFQCVCEICGKATPSQKDLRRHQMVHHSEAKSFTCQYCPRSYTAKESLKCHLRTHTGERPYKCSCGKSFHKSAVLRRHQKAVHLKDNSEEKSQTIDTDDTMNGTQETDDELNGEERMVVITLKDCNPPAVYTVQEGPSHMEEIVVTKNEVLPSQAQSHTLVANDLSPSQAVGLPLIPSQLATEKMNFSTPVLFTALSNSAVGTDHQQDILPEGISHSNSTSDAPGSSYHRTSTFPFPQVSTPADGTRHQQTLSSFTTDSSTTCLSLPTELLQFPPLQTTSSNAAQVACVDSWPT